MWTLLEQPGGEYEIVTQSGKVEKVRDTGTVIPEDVGCRVCPMSVKGKRGET